MNQKSDFLVPILCAFFALSSSSPVFAQNPAAVTIHGVSYFSIDAFSREKGFQYQWDPLTRNATVTGSLGFIKFHADSEFILNQKGMTKLKDKVLYFQGEMMAPLSADKYLDEIAPLSSVIAKTPQATNISLLAPAHRIRRVVIDAGHGDRDFGAVSPGGIKEKELVLSLAKMVEKEIRETSVEPVMTRSSDVFIPLEQRSKIANDAQADFFISIHANASPTKSLKGFEVYYLSPGSGDTAVAVEQAENFSSLGTAQVTEPKKDIKAIYLDLEASENRKESIRAANAITSAAAQAVDIGISRIRSAQFRVLKWTHSPSILIEVGYLTNTDDEIKLADPVYQRRLAKAIVRGFMNYKMEFEHTDGFTQ